jgi:hypothetical protein
MDLVTLRTNFKRAIIRTDITDAQCNTYLAMAQSRAERGLRVPANEKSATYTIPATYAHPTIPSDLLETKAIYSNNIVLRKKPLKEIIQMADQNGTEEVSTVHYYAREGNQFRLFPRPAEDAEITVIYWGEFADMIADTDENTLAAIAPDVLIYGALTYAATDYADERKGEFNAQYLLHLEEVKDLGQDDEWGDGPLQIEPATDTEY